MWRCPTCGQTFVTRNMPHSCQVVPLDSHFAGGREALRAVFDAFVAAAQESGPVTINSTKSRITLQNRMRFAAVEPRQRHLNAHVVLQRPLTSPRFTTVEHIPPRYYVHKFRLHTPEDVDAELKAWLTEAYVSGSRPPAARPAPDPPTPGTR
jgi:uncharacterized protein DUF5655